MTFEDERYLSWLKISALSEQDCLYPWSSLRMNALESNQCVFAQHIKSWRGFGPVVEPTCKAYVCCSRGLAVSSIRVR